MSDTPKDHEEGAGSGNAPEYRDPTGAAWNEGGSQGETPQGDEGAGQVTWNTGADDTQSMPSESTQQFPSTPGYEPPSGGAPQGSQSPYASPSTPYGQAPAPSQNPYGQSPTPYAQGQSPYAGGQGSQPQGQGAPGTSGYPYGQQPAYGQQQPTYGQQPGYGQQPPYGQGQGYAPSPYARPRQTNTSAIVLLIISGLSTLIGCIFAIPAVILGIMALVKQDESPAESAKFTRWGWIAYAVAVAVVVVLGIAAIAIFASMDYNSTGY